MTTMSRDRTIDSAALGAVGTDDCGDATAARDRG